MLAALLSRFRDVKLWMVLLVLIVAWAIVMTYGLWALLGVMGLPAMTYALPQSGHGQPMALELAFGGALVLSSART